MSILAIVATPYPNDFSRIGPGIWDTIKPDIVEIGGTHAINKEGADIRLTMPPKYELIKKEGWEFNVDIDVTKEYYLGYSDLCDCSGCQNFYKTIRGGSAETIAFLDQFGIDVEKPIETEWFVIDKQRKIIDYIAYYAVHGTAAKGSYEIDFGTINVAVQPLKYSPNTEMPEPYFVFQIFNLLLPWVLSDHVEDLDDPPKTKRNSRKKQR